MVQFGERGKVTKLCIPPYHNPPKCSCQVSLAQLHLALLVLSAQSIFYNFNISPRIIRFVSTRARAVGIDTLSTKTQILI